MSLVSTVNDEERTDLLGKGNGSVVETVTTTEEKPITTKSVRGFSIYHKGGGAQLSKEALYRAKVKYGIYQSPARSFTTGVAEPKVASDVAANLANDNKTTIEAYKRLFVDPNAHTAAKRSIIDGGPRVGDVEIPESHYGSHQAATRAYSVASVASEENARRLRKPASPQPSRAYSLNSANKAFYNTKFPEQTGITPRPVGKKPMDMSKVLNRAQNRAQTRVNDRLQPDKISHGIRNSTQNLSQVRSTSLTGPVYKERKGLKEPPSKEASAVTGDRHEYAHWAAFAVKDMDPTSLTGKEAEARERSRRELLTQVTSQQVLARARENADKQLDAIDAQDVHRVLFGNDTYNRAAIEFAQQNVQRKQDSAVDLNRGNINLGSGLWLSPDDVHNIAKEMVDPLLGEVHQRADDQRATDLDIQERNDYVTSEWSAWMAMHQTKEHNNQALLVNSHNKRSKEAESARSDAERNFAELCERMDKQVAERTDMLNQTKEAREQLEKETEERLAQNKEDNKEALKNFKGQHADELEDAREEQKQLVKPYHDRLEEANQEHERLLQERTEINQQITRLRESVEEHQYQISKYERDIEAHQTQQTTAEDELKNLETSKEGIQTHHDDTVVINANKAKEQALLSSEEARLKNLEVEAIINERKSELNRTEQELQREKLNMLDAMRRTAEARGDANIDEERVKQLIGMTSTEYVEKQQKSQKAIRKAERASKADSTAAPVTGVAYDQDDLENNAKEFRERALGKAEEARTKHMQSVAASSPSQRVKSSTGKSPIGEINQDNSSGISQNSDTLENGKHFSEEDLQELAEEAEKKPGIEPKSSYFKEVF